MSKDKIQFFRYTGIINWGGQNNTFETMATSEAKAKQNMFSQLAKLLNISIIAVSGNFKRNPDHVKINKI